MVGGGVYDRNVSRSAHPHRATSLAALCAVIGLLAGLACGSGATPTPTPDPRIDKIQGLAERLDESLERLERQVARLDRTPTPTASPIVTATPVPSPTPGPSLTEIKALVDSAIAAIPTAAPLVQPTPGLTEAKAEAMVGATVTAAIAAIPTALPTTTPVPTVTPASLPSLVALVPQLSGSAVTAIAGGISMKVEPGQPVAGRDVVFTLTGVDPWQRASIEFVDPRGQPVEWITAGEANYASVNDVPVTKRTLFADGAGSVVWTRIGGHDVDGQWSVRITVDGETTTVSYPVTQLQLPLAGKETVGAEFRRYQGLASDTYFSAFVSTSLAVDLQSYLGWVIVRMDESYGLRSGSIPDIYLAGDQALFRKVSEAVGVDLGFESGYFKRGGARTGIYMRVDFPGSEIRRLLTHEYVHLVLDEDTETARLPAWLEEGLATYTEYLLGLESERRDLSRRQMYTSADAARGALSSGGFLRLTSLESRSAWNSQTDEELMRLQYAEAHMAVRFLSEGNGLRASVNVAREIEAGAALSDAVAGVTGLSYQEFQDAFAAWLRDWQDPDRASVHDYIGILDGVLSDQDAIFEGRKADLASNASLSQRVTGRIRLVSDAKALRSVVGGQTPPAALVALHDDALAYLDRLVDWLTLELEHAQTGVDLRRREANAMIREIDARNNSVQREVADISYAYRLDSG